MLRSSVDGSSEKPHANRGDDPERYKSDGEVKVELGGGRGGGVGAGLQAGRGVISHITIQRGIAVKEKRLE